MVAVMATNALLAIKNQTANFLVLPTQLDRIVQSLAIVPTTPIVMHRLVNASKDAIQVGVETTAPRKILTKQTQPVNIAKVTILFVWGQLEFALPLSVILGGLGQNVKLNVHLEPLEKTVQMTAVTAYMTSRKIHVMPALEAVPAPVVLKAIRLQTVHVLVMPIQVDSIVQVNASIVLTRLFAILRVANAQQDVNLGGME